MGSFTQKITASSEHEIFLVKGYDYTARNCWYFIKVIKSRAAQFEAMIARGELTNLAEHGCVLRSGYGAPAESDYEQIKASA